MERYEKAYGIAEEKAKLSVKMQQQFSVFFSPLLESLDRELDKRLVDTFQRLLECLLLLRSRSGFLLSELGAYLLSADQAPAGTKRISNLLRSQKWDHHFIDSYLQEKAVQYAEEMLNRGEMPLLIWDSSIVEKPESKAVEGLTPVVSLKDKRLRRFRLGFSAPQKVEKLTVPGYYWASLLLTGLHTTPRLFSFSWWTHKGEQAQSFRQVRWNLLQAVREHLANTVVHVFDRGFAGSPWLGLLLKGDDHFIIRWPARYYLENRQGERRKTYRFSLGRKNQSSRKLWDSRSKSYQTVGLVMVPVLHPQYADYPLWLIISRPKGKNRKPWYLLTNLSITSKGQAWKVVMAYQKRWQVEMCFRYGKTELAIASPRLWWWENRLKFLMMLALVYAFLLSLLDPRLLKERRQLLRLGCHRTGKRYRKAQVPLYRIRLALIMIYLIQNSG